MTQIKGDGEAHPFLSPNDEFANFETLGQGQPRPERAEEAGDAASSSTRARRSRTASSSSSELGVNPYKFGMIGSTDAHTGLAAVEEDNFFGKTSSSEPSPDRAHASLRQDGEGARSWAGRQTASGYAAVWATENTREALFDAMERRETYATTGPRMIVRFFGGWDFEAARRADPQPGRRRLHARACRWAATCSDAPAGKAPTFLVAALKDPIGANLDRIQIVKGWLDAEGELQEKVYDVVWSGDRKPGADGKLPPVGNTVDVAERDLDQHDRRIRS